jgi:hypothetical protein
MFVNKAGAYSGGTSLRCSTPNIRLGRKSMLGTKTLAYYKYLQSTSVIFGNHVKESFGILKIHNKTLSNTDRETITFYSERLLIRLSFW